MSHHCGRMPRDEAVCYQAGCTDDAQHPESVWACQACDERFATHYEANQHAKQTHHLVTRPRRIDGKIRTTASSDAVCGKQHNDGDE